MKEQKNNQLVDDLRREHIRASTRNPGAAALMSFFVMGLGQIYAGHIDRGIMLMSVYFGGIFSVFSIYNGGILYNALFPMLGSHVIVVVSYILSVVFILLWIYNIKDAYYLSLFSSFRDWFEVERVLLPVLQNTSEGLISQHGRATGLLTHHVPDKDEAQPQTQTVQHEDADVVEIHATQKPDESKDDSDEEEEVLEPGQVVYATDFAAMKMHGQSWKIYFGFVLIFLLVGLWLEKGDGERMPSFIPEQNTHFAVAADMTPMVTKVSVVEPLLSAQTETAAASIPFPTPVPAPVVVPAPDVVATVVEATPEPPFAAGMEQVRAGNYVEAAKLFETALITNEPEKAEWRVILNSFYRADSLVAYEMNLRRYLSTFSDDSSAWFNLGKLLYDRSELAQAAQAIVQGLRSEPDNVRGNYLLGSIYIDLKLFPESVAYLEKALTMEPLNADFNRQLARALTASGRREDAKRYYQRILSLVPDDVEARQSLASQFPAIDEVNSVLVVQGKGEGRLIEKQTPETIEAPVSGKVLFEAEPQPQPQQEVVSKPAEVAVPAPEKAEAPSIVVSAGEKEPDANLKPVSEPAPVVAIKPETVKEPAVSPEPVSEPEAIANLKPAIGQASAEAILPDPVEIVASKIEDAVPAALEPKPAALEPSRSDPVVAVVPVEARPVMPQFTAAQNAAAVKLARAVEKSGLAAVDAGVGGKEDEFRDAVAQESSQRSLNRKIEEFRKKGASEFSRGNWEAALPNYLEVLKYKKDAQTYDMVGVIFEKLSMHKDAFDAVERSYKLGRKDAVTLTRLGRLAETTGNFTKGEQYLRKALEISPHRVDLRIRYAKCLEANGNAGQAIAELEKISRAGSDSYALKRRAELEISRIKAGK